MRIVDPIATDIDNTNHDLKKSHDIDQVLSDLQSTTRFFFISNTFISNAKLKLLKNQANAQQHPEAELLLFENYSDSSPTLSSKKNGTYSKKQAKEQVCLYS